VRAAFAAIVAAEERLNTSLGLVGEYATGRIRVDASGRYNDRFNMPDETIKKMAQGTWEHIVERLELRRFMSIKRWEELQKQLKDEKLPAITEENVNAFARGHLAQARGMLKEAVDEVFEWLRPRGNSRVGKLKTNTEMEVGERVILGYTVERAWSGKGLKVHYHRSQHVTALENVFNALDGQGEISKAYQSALETAIAASADGTGETPLFTFRACKNGNLHLTFRRLDLLARFNQVAGGTRLRPAESEADRLRREVAAERAKNERLRAQQARQT